MTVAGNDLVTLQDFIVGRLSGAELHAFEDRLIREPALVQELELSLRMREGLQRLRTRGEAPGSAPRAARLRTWAPILMAASVAAVTLILWLSRTAPTPLLSALAPSDGSSSRISAHFTFVAMRGNQAPALDLPANGLIEIRTATGADQPGQRYHVSLTRQQPGGSAEAIADLGSLAANTDGYVHFYANAAGLSPGSYVLHVQAESAPTQEADAFPFKLRR
jgi:hypothetical protein